MSEFTMTDFKIGDRVELHPATDLWMRGARHGTVIRVGTKLLTIYLDGDAAAHKRAIKLSPGNIGRIIA